LIVITYSGRLKKEESWFEIDQQADGSYVIGFENKVMLRINDTFYLNPK